MPARRCAPGRHPARGGSQAARAPLSQRKIRHAAPRLSARRVVGGVEAQTLPACAPLGSSRFRALPRPARDAYPVTRDACVGFPRTGRVPCRVRSSAQACASPRLLAACVRASACVPVRGFVVLFCEVCLEPLRDGGPACGGGGGRSGQESANGGTDGGLRKGVREERGKRSRGSERASPVARARGRPPATGCRCAALPLRAARRARARCLCSTHLHASGRELSGGNGARRVEGSLLPSISEGVEHIILGATAVVTRGRSYFALRRSPLGWALGPLRCQGSPNAVHDPPALPGERGRARSLCRVRGAMPPEEALTDCAVYVLVHRGGARRQVGKRTPRERLYPPHCPRLASGAELHAISAATSPRF